MIFWKNCAKFRPGGTGLVGPAMAGPIFELGRIIFKNLDKINVKFLKSKVYTIIRQQF